MAGGPLGLTSSSESHSSAQSPSDYNRETSAGAAPRGSPSSATLSSMEQICPRWDRGACLPPCFLPAGGRDWLCSRLLQNKYGSIWSAPSASLPRCPSPRFQPSGFNAAAQKSDTLPAPSQLFSSPHPLLLSPQSAILSIFMCPLHKAEPTFPAQAELFGRTRAAFKQNSPVIVYIQITQPPDPPAPPAYIAGRCLDLIGGNVCECKPLLRGQTLDLRPHRSSPDTQPLS